MRIGKLKAKERSTLAKIAVGSDSFLARLSADYVGVDTQAPMYRKISIINNSTTSMLLLWLRISESHLVCDLVSLSPGASCSCGSMISVPPVYHPNGSQMLNEQYVLSSSSFT